MKISDDYTVNKRNYQIRYIGEHKIFKVNKIAVTFTT